MGGRFVWKHIIPLVADTFLVAIPGFTINIFFVVEETRARDHAVAMGWVTEAEADLIEGFLAGNAGEILKGKIGKAEIEEAKHIAGIVGRRHIEEQREHVQRRILRNRRVQQLHSGLKEIETTTKRLGDRAAQARKYVDNIQPHNSEEPATIS